VVVLNTVLSAAALARDGDQSAVIFTRRATICPEHKSAIGKPIKVNNDWGSILPVGNYEYDCDICRV
jgi:hypothetical protein